MIGNRLKQRAKDWDRQFTYPVYRLHEEAAASRVEAAWLAGYRACQDAAIKRRTAKNRGAVK